MQKIGYNEERQCDVFLNDNNKTVYKIPKCRVCCRDSVYAYTFSTTCVDCTQRLQAARQARSRLKVAYSATTLKKQLDRLQYLVDLPGQVPDWVHEDCRSISKHLSSLVGETSEVKCTYCGSLMQTSNPDKSKQRCPECAARYAKYRSLCSRIYRLSKQDCVDFNRILDEYAALMRRGYWAPDIPKYRNKIKELSNVEQTV